MELRELRSEVLKVVDKPQQVCYHANVLSVHVYLPSAV